MNTELYKSLSLAFADKQGSKVEAILYAAKGSGVPRLEVLSILEKLYDEHKLAKDEVALEMVLDFMNILTFYCQPKYYIWMPPEGDQPDQPKTKPKP